MRYDYPFSTHYELRDASCYYIDNSRHLRFRLRRRLENQIQKTAETLAW